MVDCWIDCTLLMFEGAWVRQVIRRFYRIFFVNNIVKADNTNKVDYMSVQLEMNARVLVSIRC